MTDFAVFASADFDANEYANAILAGEPYPPQAGAAAKSTKGPSLQPAREDISVAIAKLNFGIDDVSKKIKNVVTTHHEGLLVQAAGVTEIQGSLTTVRGGLDNLDSSLDRLRQKIRAPYQALEVNVRRLQRLQEISDVLRRTSRFVLLAKRLQAQMADLGDEWEEPREGKATAKVNGAVADGRRSATPGLEHEGEKERTLAQAALSVAELKDLLDDASRPPLDLPTDATTDASQDRIPLQAVQAISEHAPFIDAARARITSDMENMVMTGLSENNQSLLASSLQTAHNLRVLPDLVQNLVADLSEAVEGRIKVAFDVSRISKELLSKGSLADAPSTQGLVYKSRVRTEPTNLTAPQWTNALWTRLNTLIEDMTGVCIKVYTLEKVLKLKKDPVSQVAFLDEAMKVLENRPSTTFWSSLSRSLEKQSRDAAKSNASRLLPDTDCRVPSSASPLPRVLLQNLSIHRDGLYPAADTVLILRALSSFEALYLSRTSNRFNESIGQAFQGGTRTPPSSTDAVNVTRTIANELDAAKFDPLLVRAVANHAKASLEMLMTRLDGLVARDRGTLSLQGPVASSQQVLNAALATFLYQCETRLRKLEEEYPENVFGVLQPGIKDMQDVFGKIVDPLLAAIKRELGAIVARLHRIDFARPVDPMSAGMGGSSHYVKELVEKLTFVKNEVLSKFSVGEVGREWTIAIAKDVIKTFVLHVSIVKPLDESGKLQLTTDMTELEFALGAFLLENPQSKRSGNLDVVGDDYKMLRAMRPLLFLDNSSLASPQRTAGLPPLIVLHHIFVRSPIDLPHKLHGWQETEYVRWVEEHSEEEALTLIDGTLSHWEKITESEGDDPTSALEYVQLARTVLENARDARS
ncbi:hypothetical protein EVG20_g10116 [Dentipellis fragilis]|uniref:Conserved oligomeric Golgi complex subunit 5 n=1 Tax=Dentipellis fragilis TaxID=205917 RepID=A0A4Y9XT20_9AGAM|nr:hypothetical protein EVG20_g10116 [Dentipellis fragilis]